MKKINLKSILLPSVILVLTLFLSGRPCAGEAGPVTQKSNRLTNPLLHYMKFKELKLFKDKVEQLIAKEKSSGDIDDAAVYFRSLADGIWFGIDERGKFCPASLLKVPVMMAYFKMAESDPDVLSKKIQYQLKYVQGYFPGVKQNSTAKIGQYYSVDELIKFMITESDNNADKLLLDNLPPGVLYKTFQDFGMDIYKISADEDFASLKIVASFFRILYNSSYLNEEFSEKALHYLSECTYREGLIAGLPKDIVVAHKFGERFSVKTNKKQLHEVAIVYYPENPYILGIMTRGDNYSGLARAIKDISELTYKEVDAQYKTNEKGQIAVSE